jgi:glycosyltransferase involved in cell wall biosynthesis
MKNKILIGLVDIASFLFDFQKGFQNLGIESTTCVHSKNLNIIVKNVVDINLAEFYKKPTQKYLKKVSKLLGRISGRVQASINAYIEKRDAENIQKYTRKKFQEILNNHDIFVFIWNSFLPAFSDLKKIKEQGKKIVCICVGDDIRYYQSMKQDFESFGIPIIDYGEMLPRLTTKEYLNNNQCRLRTYEKYADIVLSRPEQSQLALRPYYQIFAPISLENTPHNPTQRKEHPLLVHAPSFASGKGTKYVLEVIERLKKDGLDFSFELIQNVPNHEIIYKCANADILIDQLLTPGGGKLMLEGLSVGTVVCSFMGYDTYIQAIPKDCPVIDVNTETLYEILKSLILDHKKRQEIASKGRAYVEKYHEASVVCKQILDLLENKSKPEHFPTFFREKYIPEPENIAIYNQWTDFVKDCDWYQEYVPSGKRDGLIF